MTLAVFLGEISKDESINDRIYPEVKEYYDFVFTKMLDDTSVSSKFR